MSVETWTENMSSALVEQLPTTDISCLAGTSLECITLEQLLRNVEINNCWNQDRGEVEKIKDRVRRTYCAFSEVQARSKTLPAISTRYQIHKRTLESWRKKRHYVTPLSIQPYLKSYLPENEDERITFTYILGVFSYKRVGLRNVISPAQSIERTFDDSNAIQRFQKAIEKMFGKPAQKKESGAQLQNKQFVRVVQYCLEERFSDYVASDEERIVFLKGYFDASPQQLEWKNRGMKYVITSEDGTIIDHLLSAFFELDVYPTIESGGNRIVIARYNEFRRLYNQDVIAKRTNRRKLSIYFKETKSLNHDVQCYYQARRLVRRLQKAPESDTLAGIGRELGVERVNLNKWVSDITGHRSYEKKQPRTVDSYLALCEWLDLPHVYEAEEPIFRNEKLFIPTSEGSLFVVPKNVQQQYLDCYGIQGRTIMDLDEAYHLQEELEMVLAKDKQRDIDIKYNKKSGVIHSIKLNCSGTGRRD